MINTYWVPISFQCLSDILMLTCLLGARIAFVTTRGFGDVLEIGNQARPNIFDLAIRKPELLYEEVIEIEERVRIINEQNTSPAYSETHGSKNHLFACL